MRRIRGRFLQLVIARLRQARRPGAVPAALPASSRPRGRRRVALVASLALAGLAAPPAPAHARPLSKAGWLHRVEVTEYWPAPESWFVGEKVPAPGLSGKHRIDWLYSATGVSMEGEGIGLDGRLFHIDALGQGGWVNGRGRPTEPGKDGWSGGPPVWRAGAYWLTRTHLLTFPLDAGGWSAGTGKRYVPLPGVSFKAGAAKPLHSWRSIAVDPRVIPLGSLVYIAAYAKTPGHGWFRAQDVGGAIDGRHVDVFRTPPKEAGAGGGLLTGQRVYVIPPGAKPGRGAPPRSGAPAPAPAPAPGGSGGSSPPQDGGGAGSAPSGGAGAP
jgi:3D (Asp-Asp-Asp) domain-containing protein